MIPSTRSPAHQAWTLAALTALSACSQAQGPGPQAASSPELQQRIEALKARTLKNVVFVEGGSFMMGDFGPIHSQEKLPYSRQTDDDVLHKVTLDSYSIGAYKATYEEYGRLQKRSTIANG